MSVLQIKNFNKKYGDVTVISDLSLSVKEGEFAVLVGPSGCGKSTLLRMIAGLEEITSGELIIDGKHANNLHPRERGISMVFQSYALYPHMTVRENIGFGLKLEKRSKIFINEAVESVAETLHLSELLDRSPAQLSGGQRQRVAIGRAIVRKPRIILFDEPLSNLDAKLRVELRAELQKFHRSHNITTIYVTHDQVEAMTMADRIAVMDQGNIHQVDSPQKLFSAPKNNFVAGFIGSPQMNLMDIKNIEDGYLVTDGGLRIALPEEFLSRAKNATIFGIRPEHISSANSENSNVSASVELIESLGEEAIVYFVSEHGERFSAKIYQSGDITQGDPLDLAFQVDKIHLFDGSGNRLDH